MDGGYGQIRGKLKEYFLKDLTMVVMFVMFDMIDIFVIIVIFVMFGDFSYGKGH